MDTAQAPFRFPTTRWTMVVAAGNPSDAEHRTALAALCKNYWYPLYAYIRHRGNSPEHAQDLTQEFFIRILEGRYLDRADPAKGRFRAFVLTSLKFFMADERDREMAAKRGGGVVGPLEFSTGEERYQREPTHQETPEHVFERRWALSVLDRTVERLREEFDRRGQAEQFQRLKGFLLGGQAESYADVAGKCGMTEGAMKVAVHRLRNQYRETLRHEIADTVCDPAEVESELRFLAEVLARG